MGNYNSGIKDNRKPVKGGIFIQIPKTTYISQEFIQGTLHINLEEDFQGHILVLALEGTEQTRFTYETGTGDDRSTNYAYGDNKFLNFSMPIYDFAHNDGSSNFILRPGQWTIPFQIQIADKLPSSMKYFISDWCKCNISYHLVAQIIPLDPKYKPVEGRQEIFIGQQINMQNQQIKASQIAMPKSCCCCYHGIINLSGKINQPSFAPNEEIQIQFECDTTQCSSKVPSINVELKGFLTMNSNHKEKSSEFIKVLEKSMQIDKKQFSSSTTFKVPQSIILSANSSLIQLQYKIVVTPVVDSCCLVPFQTLEFDVQINPTPSSFQFIQTPNLFEATAPQNWNPQQLQPQQYNEQQTLQIQQIFLKYQGQSESEQFNQQNNNQVKAQQPKMVYPK